MVWYGMLTMAWYYLKGRLWHGLIRYDTVWYGTVRYGPMAMVMPTDRYVQMSGRWAKYDPSALRTDAVHSATGYSYNYSYSAGW